MTKPDDAPVIGVPQAAALLDVSPATVRALCRDGSLPAFKVGRAWRFSRRRLTALLEGEEAAHADVFRP